MHPNDISAQPDAIRKLLQGARTIAIVGLSAKTDRPSNEVAHRLQRLGYTIIPVNPAYQEVMGLKCYPDLHAVPEKIDIVDFSTDLPTFVSNALSPAKVSDAFVLDAATKAVRALVPDYQLSLAIGKEGQNARLAAKLTGAKIDIQPDSVMDED